MQPVSFRSLVPWVLKRRYHRFKLDRVLRPALSEFAADPVVAAGNVELLQTLVRAWGNISYSAMPEYLAALVAAAATARGDILECGSGLSTVLLAIAARKAGVRVWSLEHIPKWKSRVERALRQRGDGTAHVVYAPLKQYDGFWWYDVSRLPQDLTFDMVVCDGPPADTPGGRYGLLPTIGPRLIEGAEIFMDDAGRPDELAIMRRWADERRGSYTSYGVEKPFAIFSPTISKASA